MDVHVQIYIGKPSNLEVFRRKVVQMNGNDLSFPIPVEIFKSYNEYRKYDGKSKNCDFWLEIEKIVSFS